MSSLTIWNRQLAPCLILKDFFVGVRPHNDWGLVLLGLPCRSGRTWRWLETTEQLKFERQTCSAPLKENHTCNRQPAHMLWPARPQLFASNGTVKACGSITSTAQPPSQVLAPGYQYRFSRLSSIDQPESERHARCQDLFNPSLFG